MYQDIHIRSAVIAQYYYTVLFVCRGFGGWVAPNIYYLGHSGVVRYGGLRIAGASGIYKRYNYNKG